MFYTYLHLRESDGRPFYVGKGQGKRAWCFTKRNPHWQSTARAHGVRVEICAKWATENEAFEHEKFLIWCFRETGHSLVNKTDGGEGPSGFSHSSATKARLAAAATGRTKSDEVRSKIGAANRGLVRSDEFRKRMSEPKSPAHRVALSLANLGKRASESTKEKQSFAQKQLWLSDEHRAKMSKLKAGVKRPDSFSEKMSLKVWVNNGSVSRMINGDLPLPEGFVYGRLKKETHG